MLVATGRDVHGHVTETTNVVRAFASFSACVLAIIASPVADMFAPKPDLAVGLQQQPRPRRQPRLQLQQDEAFCPALQAELLQLLRRARQQLQELQRNCATGSTVTPDFSTYRKSENTLPVESDLHTAVSRAILLQVSCCIPCSCFCFECNFFFFSRADKFAAAS